jgi:hypothetical protein
MFFGVLCGEESLSLPFVIVAVAPCWPLLIDVFEEPRLRWCRCTGTSCWALTS